MLAVAMGLHVLSAVIWVGGMFFAHVVLRPVANDLLEPTVRLRFWLQIFTRFFKWVWVAVMLLLITGLWLVFLYGGMGKAGVHIHLMVGLGIFMFMLFWHIFFAPYRRLKQALARDDSHEAERRLKQIRLLMTVNLSSGVLVTLIAVSGRVF